MIPSFFHVVEQIPLSGSGKVNRKALAAAGKLIETGVEYTAPGNERERTLERLWKEVLKVEHIGMNDNFFLLGGNSLKAVELNNRIKKESELDVPVALMFKYVTIRSFTRYISHLEKGENPGKRALESSRARVIDKGKESRLRQKNKRKRKNRHVQ